VLDRDHGRGFGSPGTAEHGQSGNDRRGHKISTCPHRQYDPSSGTHHSRTRVVRHAAPARVRQAAFAELSLSHAQVQFRFRRSPSGGNM
jgi:hypothetical protein